MEQLGVVLIIRDVTLDEYRRIQSYLTFKEAWDILETMHEGISMVKRSRVIMLNRDFELCQMEEDEAFDKFNTCFYDLVNSLYNLGRPIEKEKQIEKKFSLAFLIATNLTSLLLRLSTSLEIHHFLSMKTQIAAKRIKSIAPKTTRGSASNKDISEYVTSDERSIPNEE